jgi:hypothetical protein
MKSRFLYGPPDLSKYCGIDHDIAAARIPYPARVYAGDAAALFLPSQSTTTSYFVTTEPGAV